MEALDQDFSEVEGCRNADEARDGALVHLGGVPLSESHSFEEMAEVLDFSSMDPIQPNWPVWLCLKKKDSLYSGTQARTRVSSFCINYFCISKSHNV